MISMYLTKVLNFGKILKISDIMMCQCIFTTFETWINYYVSSDYFNTC